MFKKFKGFKTVAFNSLAFGAAVAEYYGVLPAVDQTALVGVVAVANLVLRFATDTPVFAKK